MASRISKDTEARLVACLEKVAALVEGGRTPTEALVKVAGGEDLGPGLVRLMAQAYNNGRTNAQRRSAEDLFDKSASFALADAQAAIRELYPEAVKTAAERHRASAVSAEYDVPPRPLRGGAGFEKAADCRLVERAPEAYPREGGRHAALAYSLVREAGQELDERRRLLSTTRDKLASAFGELRDHFRRGGHVEQARVNSRLLFGAAADVVFRQLSLDDPLLAKAAAAGREPQPSHAPAGLAPYSLVGDCIRLARECRDREADLSGLRAKTAAARAELSDRLVPDPPRHAGSILRPMKKQAIFDDDLRDLMERGLGVHEDEQGNRGSGNVSDFLSGAVGTAASGFGQEMFQRVAPKPLDKLRGDAFTDLTSPEHEAKLRNVRAQAVLHDILANDEYLAGEPPDKVVNMYNEITKLSPRAAEQPMLIRSLLRRYMQQPTVEPHDIDQQLGLENKLKDRDRPRGEYGLPPAVGTNFETPSAVKKE